MMIPKIIHQIWVGKVFPTKEQLNIIYDFKRKAEDEGFEHKFWTNENYPIQLPHNLSEYKNLCREYTTPNQNLGAFEADMLRYYLIYEHGGFYFDADFVLTNPLTPFYDRLSTYNLVFTRWMNRPSHPSNAFLGAVKNHAFYLYLYESINHKTKTPNYIGPAFLGRQINNYFSINLIDYKNGEIILNDNRLIFLDWTDDFAFHKNNLNGIIKNLAYYSWRRIKND